MKSLNQQQSQCVRGGEGQDVITDALITGPNGEPMSEDAFPFGKPEGPKGGQGQGAKKSRPMPRQVVPAGSF